MPTLYKLVRRINQALDRLTGVKYDGDMSKKPIITPERFEAVKEIYNEAVQKRQEEIKRLYFVEKRKPSEIAKRMKMDETQVSRFLAQIKKGD